MGGGGGLLGGVTNALFGSPAQAATPDYTSAANATAAGNLSAAQAATAANSVNQVTPYGNLNYAVTGQDPYGNPTWTATTSLSDVGQKLLNNQDTASLGLGSSINTQLGNVQKTIDAGFNPNLPSTGFNPGQSYQDAYMQRLMPQINQSRESNAASLANQGVVPGTKAYENAMRTQSQKENDLLASVTTQGFGTGLQANQQGYNQALTNYNLPLNTLSALRTGAQVQNPSFVNNAQQATTAGADLLGAAGLTGQSNIANANATNAQTNAMMGGLFKLGGAALA